MRAARVSAVLAFAVVAASSPALPAQPAAALEPGVHIDPGSPAAKEYALPVSQARGTGGGASEGAREQLFGAGIKPPSSGSPSGGSKPAAAGAHRAVRQRPGDTPPGSREIGAADPTGQEPPASLVRRVAKQQSSTGVSSSLLVLLGGGVMVIVLGALAGVVLRRSRRPTSAA